MAGGGFDDPQTFKQRQMELIAQRAQLHSAADLDAFLARDPKTRDNPKLQAVWRQWLRDAVPELRT